jgi:hypothetical protein
LNGRTGQFAVVEKAIAAGEWPYDNGDDPSFYATRKGGRLTWGVCRQELRNSIKPGSIVVFFSFTPQGSDIRYRLSAVVTVAEKLDRRFIYSDARFSEHLGLYLNVLIKPQTEGWQYDETDREKRARHPDWLWRIAVHGRGKDSFQSKHKNIYQAGRFDNDDISIEKNYVLFSNVSDETYISPDPPEVAIAQQGRHEQWTNQRLRTLTVEVAAALLPSCRNYLRTINRSGRNVHRQIRFDMQFDQATEWRHGLISALREIDQSPIHRACLGVIRPAL